MEANINNDNKVGDDGKLWKGANHIALVVSNVGRSVSFYADVLGLEQVMRPDFDR